MQKKVSEPQLSCLDSGIFIGKSESKLKTLTCSIGQGIFNNPVALPADILSAKAA